ncbi:MAG: hypothetical protein ACO3TP_03115 [Ilumatobacteraceae bacterium]
MTMEIRTQREVVDQMVASHRLSFTEADKILNAPRFKILWRALLSYIAVLVIGMGLVRVVVALFEEASETIIAVSLLVASAVFGVITFQLWRHEGWRRRAGEFCEIVSLGSLVAGGAILLVDADIDGAIIAVSAGSLGVMWALLRVRFTEFSSAIIVIPSTMAVCGGIVEWAELDFGVGAIPFLIGGSLLIGLGQGDYGAAILIRIAGVVTVFSSVPQWLDEYSGLDGLIPALGIGALLLWTGMQWNRIEQIIGGSAVTVIAIVVYLTNNIDNDLLQGVAIVAVGVAGLVFTAFVVKRQRQSSYVTTTGA